MPERNNAELLLLKAAIDIYVALVASAIIQIAANKTPDYYDASHRRRYGF